MDVNILFTSAGRRVELLRCFRRAYEDLAIAGRIIAVDIDPLAPALREADRAYLVPRLDSPNYMPSLQKIIEREQVKAVFPLIDPDVPILAAGLEMIETLGARLAVVSPQASKVAEDKWETVAFFNSLGVPAPCSWLPEDIDHSAISYPLFIKPRRGSASQQTFKVENARQLAFFCDYIPRPIVQEYLPGPEITNDVVCDLEGELLSVVSRQRIRVRGGEVTVGKTLVDVNIAAACRRIAASLPAKGPITVQCIMKGEEPLFTEINARLGGGAPLGIAAGDDWPRRLLASIAGIGLDGSGLCRYAEGVYLSRFDDSIFVTEAERSRMAAGDDNREPVIGVRKSSDLVMQAVSRKSGLLVGSPRFTTRTHLKNRFVHESERNASCDKEAEAGESREIRRCKPTKSPGIAAACSANWIFEMRSNATLSNFDFDAVIFDLDDTLYLESQCVRSGFRAVADWAEKELSFVARETLAELQALFDAGIRGNSFDLWLQGKGLDVQRWRATMVDVYRNHEPDITLAVEADRVLEALRSRCRIGLVSDGHLDVQKRKVAALGLQNRLDCIVYSDELGRDAWKPDPRPFREALSRLGAAAERSVYIGDNPAKDFGGARRLGMATVRVRLPGGLHRGAEAHSAADDADVEIEKLSRLPETLCKLGAKRAASQGKTIRIDGPAVDARKSASPVQKRIYLSPPHMAPRSRELLLEAFDSNWIAPLGPHVERLEQEFAEKIGAARAVALSSGTAALHLGLLALGVGPGDEVCSSTLTFAATANAIRYVGAQPVFIDSDAATWNMDPRRLTEALADAAKRGKPPKAVICVDLYGQCCDYAPILDACRRYNIPVIEDAAEALGATYRGEPAGNFGRLGCFSFNGNKIITASSGGMVVCRDESLARRIRHLATQARDPAVHYQHSQIGYNYRLSNLLAAVARGQLEVLDGRVARRREVFRFYEQHLGGLPGLRFMPESVGGRSTRWLTCLTVDERRFGCSREEIRLALEAENIESRPVWKPMHLQPVHAGCRVHGGEVARRLFENGLCLPSGSNLSEEDLRRVVGIVSGLYRSKTRACGNARSAVVR